MSNTSSKFISRLTAILLGVAAVSIITLAKYGDFNPTARAGRDKLAHLSASDVVSVRFDPTSDKSVIAKSLTITDREQLAALVQALSPMTPFQPNHPGTSRAVVMRVTFKDREVGGELRGDGSTVRFYYMSDGDTGWVFGTYLVPRGSQVFDLIAQHVAAP